MLPKFLVIWLTFKESVETYPEAGEGETSTKVMQHVNICRGNHRWHIRRGSHSSSLTHLSPLWIPFLWWSHFLPFFFFHCPLFCSKSQTPFMFGLQKQDRVRDPGWVYPQLQRLRWRELSLGKSCLLPLNSISLANFYSFWALPFLWVLF